MSFEDSVKQEYTRLQVLKIEIRFSSHRKNNFEKRFQTTSRIHFTTHRKKNVVHTFGKPATKSSTKSACLNNSILKVQQICSYYYYVTDLTIGFRSFTLD